MFARGQQVKVIHCPSNSFFVGKQVTLINKEIAPNLKPADVVISDYQSDSSFWLVQENETLDIVEAYVEHFVKPGDQVIVDRAPIGWREIEGKVRVIAGVSVGKDGKQYSVVTPPANLIAPIVDFTPVKFPERNPPIIAVEPDTDSVSREDIASAALKAVGTDFASMSDDVLELLSQLGVSMADHAEVTAETYISLEFREEIKYSKGVEINDKVAVAQQLADKFKRMSTGELTSYLLGCIEGVDAQS